LLPESPELYGLPTGGAVEANEYQAVAFLEESLKSSPIKEAVLTAATLKYFGHVHV
jgi:hypothetical protein